MKSATESNFFSGNKTLQLHGRLLTFDTPRIMGILNVTPDSFYDGGKFTSDVPILQRVENMLAEGATFIDVGGYSSRPGAQEVPLEEELKRSVNAIKLIIKHFPEAIISIDTFRSEVARQAVGEGACLINDISGGELDTQMLETVANLNVPYILMHMRGTPQTMSKQTGYDNLILDILDFFHPKIERLHRLGVKDIIIDPGFGFAKTPAQGFELLNKLDQLSILGKPILVGMSRKSMIWRTLNIEPDDALTGTITLNTIALLKGANILRVHDVKEAIQVVTLVGKLGTHNLHNR